MSTTKNIHAYDIIIELIKSIKENKGTSEYDYNGNIITVKGAKYLLGQYIRQIEPSPDRKFVSVGAKELWDRISSNNINNYYYNECIICNNREPIYNVPFYKGAYKRPYTTKDINNGDKIQFNDVFHLEHVVDISSIIKELLKVENITYSDIDRILSKMAVARILKSEDRQIKVKSNRGTDLDKALAIYNDAGIKLVNAQW